MRVPTQVWRPRRRRCEFGLRRRRI
jgi:hypothetical protein